MTVNTEISNAFNAHAREYEDAAKVQKEIGTRLFERLDYLARAPRYVLDLGCGPGYFTQQLRLRYPNAVVVGFDIALEMLSAAREKQRFWRKWPMVQGDMAAMPFVDNLFDLVFANQVVHWAPSLLGLLRELNRVMNPDGCLMFSTLGPDTFSELKQAWATVDTHAHANEFCDMHDLGDMLMAEQFLEPVVDMEKITCLYQTLPKLVHALKSQGVRNINPARKKGLTTKASWARVESAMSAFCTSEGKFPLTYEVVYGHAWKGMQTRVGEVVETRIPISQIGKLSEPCL